MAEPPAALDLKQPEVVYSGCGALHYEKSWLVRRFEPDIERCRVEDVDYPVLIKPTALDLCFKWRM